MFTYNKLGGWFEVPADTMLSLTGSLKVFLALEACDLRKGFNGLQGVVAEVLKEELRSGALFVFCNRRHTRLKMLYWDDQLAD